MFRLNKVGRNTRVARAWCMAVLMWPAVMVAESPTEKVSVTSAVTGAVTSAATITPTVELYTSEGCSSCPPADDFLRELGRLNGQHFTAVPLAFHVDYWNRLGWIDAYSKAEFTTRQRKIAQLNRQRNIYTPEFVVGGQEVRRGGGAVVDRIHAINQQPARVDIRLTARADESHTKVHLMAHFDNRATVSANVHWVIYENNIVRAIEGGENRGRTLMHDYVVRHFGRPRALVSGISTVELELPLANDWVKENLGVAVLVIEAENGATLQALSTPLVAADDGV